MELKNKVVLVTGSSIGIGRETAIEFAKEGAAVVITYKTHKEEAEEVYQKCLEVGASDVLLLHLDLLEGASIKECVSNVIEKFGKISFLINNAGVSNWMLFKKMTFEDISNEIGTNLEGLIKITHTSIDHIEEGIVNVSSILGMKTEEMETVYCASKWGIRGFTKALALEYQNLKIISVNPRGTATAMNDFVGDPPSIVGELIVKVCKGSIDLKSGDDLNTWDYIH